MIHKVGDVLFFLVDGVAGEGVYIGTTKGAKDVLILVVGKQAVEMDPECCSATAAISVK